MPSDQQRFSRGRFLSSILPALALPPALACLARSQGEGAAPADLLTRPIPSTGERIPVVGLGTWQTFDVNIEHEAFRRPRLEVLRALLEAGASVIDSSPMYGRAEAVVGELLDELGAHERAFLATKVWTRGRDAGVAQMEQSFDRLRTPRIELMQIHNLLDWREHLPALRDWKAQGRFRYIGITHYTTSSLRDLARVLEREPFDFVQCAYSIGVRDAEERLFPVAIDRGVAVLVNRPYEGGSLFRLVGDHPVPDWAREFGCESWGQFFLKFILSAPGVTCAIPGTANPAHMRDNLGAARGRLPNDDERERMIRLWRRANR